MSIKRMKKALAVVLCAVILVVAGTFVCTATDNRYTISELNDMTLYLPDDMSAITRSSQSTDRYFSVFGLNYDTTMQNFRNSDIYLQGMDSNADVTITVTMTKTSDSEGISNYNLLQSDELTQVKENFLSQGEYSSCTPDNAKNIVWLIFDTTVSNNGKTIKAYQANTVYDGMSINVTLQRNEGNVKASDYQTFYSIVSSVNFLKAESADYTMIFAIIIGVVLLIILIIVTILVIKKLTQRIKKSKNDRIIEELSDKYTRRNRYRYVEEQEDSDGVYGDFLGDAVSEEVIEQPTKEIAEEEIEEKEEIEEAEKETTSEEYELEEFEEESDYNNDEELVRMEAKKTKFIDSDDFFEEAPKKTMGVISSKDIRDAEDYDVIEEVEKKAIEVEKPAPKKGEAVVKVFKAVGGSIKSFFVHCGYFCTNVSRMIKHNSAKKKRQKAEEERRQRARMRAARERQQRREIQDKGLVQVRRRDEQRRPDSRNGKNRR